MANLIKRKQSQDQGQQTCYAGRNATNQPNQSLRRDDGMPTVDRPFLAFFDGEIYALACGDRDNDPANATWTMEVEVNGAVIASIVKPAGQSENSAELLGITNPDLLAISPVNVSQNDRISLWMRSQNQRIDYPSGQVAIRKRR